MSSDRWIVLSGSSGDAASGVLAFGLARALEPTANVLLWDTTSTVVPSAKRWSDLSPYISAFSPDLLRNFLRRSEAHLCLLQGPVPASDLVEGVVLLKRSFDFVLVYAESTWKPAYLSLMDQAHLVILVLAPVPEQIKAAQDYLGQLAQHKYPQAICQCVLDGNLPAGAQDWRKALGRDPLISVTKETFPADLRKLAQKLQTQESLYQSCQEMDGSATREVKERLHQRLLEKTSAQTCIPSDETKVAIDVLISQESSLSTSREARNRLCQDLLNDVLGLGPIEPLLKDPEVAEVMVNGPGTVFVERKGRLHPTDVIFENETQLRTVIDRIVAPIGRRVDESTPLCDARLADGSRVNIVLPPLALNGPVLTIRKFMEKRLMLEDLIKFGALNAAMAEHLTRCVKARKNMIISGGTGSGKTTLLNILSGLIAPEERIVTIEDAAELKLQQPHVVRLESRPANAEGQGAIPIRRLVINALRMRPDRIVVGECRGGEALDMLQAMNTGHDGSLTTLHANTPRDALGRLEALVLMAGIDLPVRVVREQIKSAVDVIIQVTRLSDGARKITSITELTGMEGDILTTVELFRFQNGGFEATGLVSQSL